VARDAAGGVGGAEAGRGVTLLDALYAFYQEHERCGDSAVDSGPRLDGVYVRPVINRCADDESRTGRLLRDRRRS